MTRKETEQEMVHFYRGKNPTIVWDKRKDQPLVDFSKGHVFTSDPFTIEVLREIGYIEIPLDANKPPEIIEPIQPEGMPDVRSLPRGMTEKAAAEVQREQAKKMAEDNDGPAVPVPKAKSTSSTPTLNPVIEDAPIEKPKKKSRTIKRRGQSKK